MITSSFKYHEIRDFVNRLTKIATEYSNCQCIRELISQEVNITLRKQEVKENVPAPR